jgi:hypothetical protein
MTTNLVHFHHTKNARKLLNDDHQVNKIDNEPDDLKLTFLEAFEKVTFNNRSLYTTFYRSSFNTWNKEVIISYFYDRLPMKFMNSDKSKIIGQEFYEYAISQTDEDYRRFLIECLFSYWCESYYSNHDYLNLLLMFQEYRVLEIPSPPPKLTPEDGYTSPSYSFAWIWLNILTVHDCFNHEEIYPNERVKLYELLLKRNKEDMKDVIVVKPIALDLKITTKSRVCNNNDECLVTQYFAKHMSLRLVSPFLVSSISHSIGLFIKHFPSSIIDIIRLFIKYNWAMTKYIAVILLASQANDVPINIAVQGSIPSLIKGLNWSMRDGTLELVEQKHKSLINKAMYPKAKLISTIILSELQIQNWIDHNETWPEFELSLQAIQSNQLDYVIAYALMMQLYLPINLDYQVLFKKKLGQLIPIHFKEQVKIDQAMRRMQAVAVEQAIDASYINRLIKAAKGFVNNFVIRFEKD